MWVWEGEAKKNKIKHEKNETDNSLILCWHNFVEILFILQANVATSTHLMFFWFKNLLIGLFDGFDIWLVQF